MILNKKPQYIFFIGKGGVGKSTVSALTSLKISSEQKVLLVSMDPAHNQSDIFKMKFSETPLEINNNLQVLEINSGKLIKSYLRDIEDKVRSNYLYLSAFNLEKNFNIIKYSPGMEEYALMTAFEKIRKKYSGFNNIVFDMPPTALATKFFSLPSLSLVWNDHLIKLREDIIKKKELITKIKLNKKEFEFDKILKNLEQQKEFYSGIKNIFEDKNLCSINLVMNTDDLSVSESARIINRFKEIHIDVTGIVINKVMGPAPVMAIKEKFERYPAKVYPLSEGPLIGIDALNNFLRSTDY